MSDRFAAKRSVSTVEDARQKLKRRREELRLTYRDVEEASLQIAAKRKNDEFAIALSRLADIENKGIVPSIYRLYALCAIYRVDFVEALEWYGIDISDVLSDAAAIEIGRTHTIEIRGQGRGSVQLPIAVDPGIDLSKTTYLSRLIQRWGQVPLMLLNGLDLKDHRYALVGSNDWFMYPLIHPGSLVLIDETRSKVVSQGWSTELERPVYFLMHRAGYAIGWCDAVDDKLIMVPHPASGCSPVVYFPDEVEVLGQISGVAMRLDQARRRRIRL